MTQDELESAAAMLTDGKALETKYIHHLVTVGQNLTEDFKDVVTGASCKRRQVTLLPFA